MNARLLLIALGCGAADAKLLPLRNTGSSKVLTLRGGNTGQLINAMAALNAVSGLQGWTYPEETLKMYGVKAGVTESESFIMRCVGGVQLASAVRANVTRRRPLAIGTVRPSPHPCCRLRSWWARRTSIRR